MRKSVGREKIVAFDVEGADFVLTAFRDDETDDHSGWGDVIELDVLNGKINIAVVLVVFHQGVLVVVKVVLLQNTCTGQPRKHPAAAGFDGFAQFSLCKGVGIDKEDILDFDLGGFVNQKSDRAASGQFINGRRLDDDGGFLVAGFLIDLLHFLGVLKKLPLVQGLADL